MLYSHTHGLLAYAATTIPKLYPHLSSAFLDHTSGFAPASSTPYNAAARRAYLRVLSKSEDAAKHIQCQLNPTDLRNNNNTRTSPDSRHLQKKISKKTREREIRYSDRCASDS